MNCPNCNIQMDALYSPYEDKKKKEEAIFAHFICPGVNCYVEYSGIVKRELTIFEETGSVNYASKG